jgi:hypothetical protein
MLRSIPTGRGNMTRFTKITLRLLLAGSTLVLLVVAFFYIFVLDALDWGAIYSKNFTWKKFESIQPGDSIEAVIQDLGEPIRPAGGFKVNMPGDRLLFCKAESRCLKYQFSGTLFFGGREAIVIVDRSSRRVVATWINREP